MATNWTEQELWQRYLMLSKELLKSINAQNIELFLEQVDQRHKLMEMMQAHEGSGYRESAEGQSIINEIKPLDMQIIYKAKTWLNKSRRQNLTVRSYDLTGQNPLGNVVNQSY